MRCGGGAAESSKMLTQQTGGAAESSKMLTQQTGRGDRWLRGAGGDPVAGDRWPVTGDPPALPPFPGGAPGEEGRRPSACPRRGYGDQPICQYGIRCLAIFQYVCTPQPPNVCNFTICFQILKLNLLIFNILDSIPPTFLILSIFNYSVFTHTFS